MDRYELKPKETILMENRASYFGKGLFGKESIDLLLTDLSIILAIKNYFDQIKGIIRIDLNDIKTLNGQPLVKIENDYYLLISTLKGEFKIVFHDKREARLFCKNITNLLYGDPIQLEVEEKETLFGSEELAETWKNTVNTFKKSILGEEPEQKKQPEKKISPMITAKCIGCGAPLSGRKGTIQHCTYCDTDQVIK